MPDGGQLHADTDRQATRRAAFLEQTTQLAEREAQALAYSELGFSSAGIAKEIDASQSTVKTYLGRAIATFGPAVAEVRLTFEVDRRLEPVTPGDLAQWSDRTHKVWTEAAQRHPERVPDAITVEAVA
jgi:DNA-binding CsgD family transcriptional regulator